MRVCACLDGAILTDELIRRASAVSRRARMYRAQCSEASASADQLSPDGPLKGPAPEGASVEGPQYIPQGQGHE